MVCRSLQVELAVVPADQHLQHRLLGRYAALEPLGQEPHDLLGDRGQRLDPLGVVAEAAVGRQRGELVAHRGQHVGPLGVDRRLVEPAEPDAAGEVADDREPQLGGAAEPFEQGTGVAAERSPVGVGSSIQRPSNAEASAISGAERCWARKIRNTACSSSGVRSRSSTP